MSRFRPDLPIWYGKYIEKMRLMEESEFSRIMNVQPDNSEKTWNFETSKARFLGTTEKSITTLEEALEFCDADLTKWSPVKWSWRSWDTVLKNSDGDSEKRTSYRVAVEFEPIKREFDFEVVREQLNKHIKNTEINNTKSGKGIGVVCAADFHVGADIRDLINTPDFDISVLTNYLTEMAAIINDCQFKEVRIFLLGDFIESFTGLNHPGVWKELSHFGMNAVIVCFELLRDFLLSKINNLTHIYMVSGNHDRVTSDSKADTRGEVAQLLYYMLSNEFKGVKVVHSPVLISESIDGIYYVATHGHHRLSQKDTSKVLFEYGKQGMYNVVLRGHDHSRKLKGTRSAKAMKYDDFNYVQFDQANYRAITVPSLFTGNFWSETMGFSSSSGFLILQNNGKGKIRQYDFCL